MKFRYKTLPKIFYFAVELSCLVPLIYMNIDELITDTYNICFFIGVIIMTLLTFYQYLKVAQADPGIINSMNFNKAYQDETEISQNNLT